MSKFIGEDAKLFAELMLENGFFPENLPPVFKVTNLHEAAIAPLAGGDYLTDKPTESCRYNSSKRGGQRRTFSMPNPVFMIDAAIFFTKFQNEIDEHLSSSDDSCSYPTFASKSTGRPISITSFPEFHKQRRQQLAMSRYVVKTDISRFYHSIYTHSLPWALHGKPMAKRDRKVDSSEVFGNRIDWLVRQAQDGQTVGIPVGPDFSRIVSEIVGVAIDKKFRGSHGPEVSMLRLVDDIYIGADNIDDAYSYLSSIRDSISAFELDINESKTSILNAGEDLEPYWPVEIRRELERYSSVDEHRGLLRADFVHFLDEILRISSSRKDDGIVKFALRKIDELSIWGAYWELLEPFLVRVAINFPHCWDYVARVVAWRSRVEDIDKSRWQAVADRSISQNLKSSNDSEIVWALWVLKEIRGKLELTTLEHILRRCGPFPCLLALDIHHSSNVTYKLPKELLLEKLGERPMMGSNWLLAYEADNQFGLKIKSKVLQGSAFFKQLYDDVVSFYDREAMPVVFEDVDDLKTVTSAIESPISSYDDVYEEELDDDEIEF